MCREQVVYTVYTYGSFKHFHVRQELLTGPQTQKVVYMAEKSPNMEKSLADSRFLEGWRIWA